MDLQHGKIKGVSIVTNEQSIGRFCLYVVSLSLVGIFYKIQEAKAKIKL